MEWRRRIQMKFMREDEKKEGEEGEKTSKYRE